LMGLLGPILEGGRVGTPRKARGVMCDFYEGDVVSEDTLAIDLVSVVLEQAIVQLDAYEARLKHVPAARAAGAAGKPGRKAKEPRADLLPHRPPGSLVGGRRSNVEALQVASSVMDGLLVDCLACTRHASRPPSAVRIFLSAHGDSFGEERLMLDAALGPVRAALAQAGRSLVLVDVRKGSSEEAAAVSMTWLDLLVRLEQVKDCWAVLALLGAAYGSQLTGSLAWQLAAKEGWAWVSALAGRSVTECEVTCALRAIYAEDAAATQRCLVYIKEFEAHGAGVSVEDEERQVRQRQLIDDLLSHRSFHCHSYSTPQQGMRSCANQLMELVRKDLLGAGSGGAAAAGNDVPPLGCSQVQAALASGIPIDPAPRPQGEASDAPGVESGGEGEEGAALVRGDGQEQARDAGSRGGVGSKGRVSPAARRELAASRQSQATSHVSGDDATSRSARKRAQYHP